MRILIWIMLLWCPTKGGCTILCCELVASYSRLRIVSALIHLAASSDLTLASPELFIKFIGNLVAICSVTYSVMVPIIHHYPWFISALNQRYSISTIINFLKLNFCFGIFFFFILCLVSYHNQFVSALTYWIPELMSPRWPHFTLQIAGEQTI